MYAIVDIAGEQFRVSQDQQILTPKLEGDAGSKLELDKVLFLSTDKDARVGMPYLDGTKVMATIVSHNKGDKVLVFKKKRRKGYRVLNGHRQMRTLVKIDKIVA
jgi:large subunit ribosomal protein L21